MQNDINGIKNAKNQQPPLEWVDYAHTLIGTREIKGSKHNPKIQAWLKELGAWYVDDETPWCGVFVAHVMKKFKRKIPKFYMRALAWDSSVCTKLSRPAYGCIVTFKRTGGGHVGFVVGEDSSGRILVLGGNQGDEVNIRAFPKSRVEGYYWPIREGQSEGQPNRVRYEMKTLLASNFKLSTNEA